MRKNHISGLVPTWIILNFESDLDHRLNRKKTSVFPVTGLPITTDGTFINRIRR